MNPKDQATQQSIENYNRINKVVNPASSPTFFKDYWTKGFKLGRFEEREDFAQPAARFANFLTEQFIEAPISGPKTISEGIGEAKQGRYYSAAGKIGTGIVDVATVFPVLRAAKLSTTAPKLTKAIAAGAKEGAAYGGAYGLFEGLTAAQDAKSEDRLGVIAEATIKGSAAGVLIGGAVPAVVGGAKKLYKLFYPDNLPQVTKALDTKLSSIVKEAEDLRNRPNIPSVSAIVPEIKPAEAIKQPVKKLRAALPVIKKDITEANIQFKQVGKQIVQEAETAAKSTGQKLSKVNPAIKAKAEDIITNLAAGNKDGALEISANLDIEEFGKTVKFLESLRDKGNLPEQAKAELDDLIKTSLETRYTPRESKKEFNAISAAIDKIDATDRDAFAKSILDIVNRTNSYIYENGIEASQRPYLIQNAINSFYIDTFGASGNAVDYIDALAAKYIAEGNVSLGKRLFTATAFIRTSYGQGIESGKRSLSGQIEQANDALNILRGAKNSELNKKINAATEDITNEITGQIDTLIDSGATQKQIMSYVNKVMTENFGKDWGGLNAKQPVTPYYHGTRQPLRKEKGLFSLTDDINYAKEYAGGQGGRRDSGLDEITGAIVNGTEEWKLNKTTDLFEYKGKTMTRSEMNELGQKWEATPIYKNERVDTYYLPNDVKILDLTSTEGLDVLSKLSDRNNPTAKGIVDNIKETGEFDWQITKYPEVFNKVFLPQLENLGYFGIKFSEKNGNRTTAIFDTSKLLTSPPSPTRVKTLQLKELPFDTLARKIEGLAKRIPRDSVQVKEQEVVDAMVRQLYVIAKDTIKAPINPSNPDSIYKTLKTALSNKAKYKQVWEKAKNRVMETYKNDEEAYAILQDYFARNVPDVFKESQAQKAYRNLIKEDGVRFNQLVREHFTSQAETREGLTLKLQAKLGLPQAQAADLSSKIYQYFNTNLEGARRAAIDRIITPIIRNPKQKKEVIDTIIEYSNLGIFNNVDYANAVASKLGLPHLTDENAQFIAKTMDRLQRGEIDNDTALRAIAEDISKANKLDFIRNPGDRDVFVRSYFYNNIFSSFQTWERNLLGGLVNAFIVRPSIIAGERAVANIFKVAGKELPEKITSLPKGELGQYYKQLFGSIGSASNKFMEVMTSPNFIGRSDNPTVRYYFDKGRENQLPKLFTTVGRFMEALDQFNATLIMNAEENLMRNRGFSPEVAREKAFAVSQELLGRLSFGKGFQRGDFSSGRFKEKVKEQGWIDPFFDTIGNKGYELRGSGGFIGFATTAILPVIRIAINLQKLKTKLFLPTQLFDVLAKDPANRKLQDYGYLAASGVTTAFAIDKFFKGEVEFAAPRDEKARQLFFDAGKKPYSVKIGDNYVPFQYLEVFGAPFLAMGAIKAAFQDNPDALNQNVLDKTSLALYKFAEAYFVSPTYLSTIANIADSLRQINGKDWTQALAYPATGLVPFSGLLRDLADIYDPIRRKKKDAWDEFKALYAPFKEELEPLRNADLRPVELNASELYAPYGIGTVNQEREAQYDKRIKELQQTKFRQSQLKDEKERITSAKTELEIALRGNDNRLAAQVIREQKLTPAEVSSVTNKIKEEQAKARLSPEEVGLYGLTARELEFLNKQNPELKPLISKVSSFKESFVSPNQNVFEELKSINQVSTKKLKTRRATKGKRIRIKKVRAKKFKIPKSKAPKVKKLKAVKTLRI
jgi:hypothetical protein